MRRVLAALSFVGVGLLTNTVFANGATDICFSDAGIGDPPGIMAYIGDQPGSTLLLPYFEVETRTRSGANTVFSVNNASATAVLTHITIWSDLAVPVLAFNVYLTGYDVQTIDLKEVLNGRLPKTASDGQDPADTANPNDGISNQGELSQDINFASCNGQFPFPDQLSDDYIAHMKASLTGKASAFYSGKCSGLNRGDSIARGYVTIDTVTNCTLRFPGDAGYFINGGGGDASNQNYLWGQYYYLPKTRSSHGEALVPIRTSSTEDETSVPGNYTFYGRYAAWTAADNRQPLPTSFISRYSKRSKSVATSLIVWRDPKVNQNPFTCGSLPTWYPLGQEGITIFDQEENPVVMETSPVSPQPPNTGLIPFGAATQRVLVGSTKLPVPFTSGQLYLNLSTTITGNANPPEDPAAAQAWVHTVQDSNRAHNSGAGYRAIANDSATNACHYTPGN